MNALLVLLVGLSLVACGVIGAALLGPLNRAGTGFLLGFLLGPVGILVIWVRRPAWIRRQTINAAAAQLSQKEQAWREWRGH
jgi:hypothetical protein